jgi:hypothetical protein
VADSVNSRFKPRLSHIGGPLQLLYKMKKAVDWPMNGLLAVSALSRPLRLPCLVGRTIESLL